MSAKIVLDKTIVSTALASQEPGVSSIQSADLSVDPRTARTQEANAKALADMLSRMLGSSVLGAPANSEMDMTAGGEPVKPQQKDARENKGENLEEPKQKDARENKGESVEVVYHTGAPTTLTDSAKTLMAGIQQEARKLGVPNVLIAHMQYITFANQTYFVFPVQHYDSACQALMTWLQVKASRKELCCFLENIPRDVQSERQAIAMQNKLKGAGEAIANDGYVYGMEDHVLTLFSSWGQPTAFSLKRFDTE